MLGAAGLAIDRLDIMSTWEETTSLGPLQEQRGDVDRATWTKVACLIQHRRLVADPPSFKLLASSF